MAHLADVADGLWPSAQDGVERKPGDETILHVKAAVHGKAQRATTVHVKAAVHEKVVHAMVQREVDQHEEAVRVPEFAACS